MNHPTNRPKVVLVADARRQPGVAGVLPIRRYRLARLRRGEARGTGITGSSVRPV